jgi:hypothetical protein
MLLKFDAFEDDELKEGEKLVTCGWVEEWRGEEVRSRLVVREFNTEKRLDVFSACPDSFYSRFQLARCASKETLAILVIDVSVAFMHATLPETESIKVKPPPDIPSRTGVWRLKKALNGTRKASQAWTEHSAEILIANGATRNTHNPAIFAMLIDGGAVGIEQHGDDFLCDGERSALVKLRSIFEDNFLCKKAVLVSREKEDEKEAWFLHRRVWVDNDGWHEELDERYVNDIVKQAGVENGRKLTAPGVKEAGDKSSPLGKAEHSQYRGIGGLAQYITDRRGDLCFATKEILRKCNAPSKQDENKTTRIGKYLEGTPRCIQDFPWQPLGDTLDTYVDTDWGGEQETSQVDVWRCDHYQRRCC